MYPRDAEIAEFMPEIFDSIETDHSDTEQTNPFNAQDAADGDTSGGHPGKPPRCKFLSSVTVQLDERKHGCRSEEQQH